MLEQSVAVEHAVLPVAFVPAAARVAGDTVPVLPTLLPLALVLEAIGELVDALAFEHTMSPVAFVP